MINSFRGEYAFLSNFYHSPIKIFFKTFPTVEHFYQWSKTEDIKFKENILNAVTPGEAKRYGKHVPLRKDWNEIRNKVMLHGVRAKFYQHKDLALKLINTNPHELIEGNTWGDTYWGVCNGKGENMLGKILMQIRKEIGN